MEALFIDYCDEHDEWGQYRDVMGWDFMHDLLSAFNHFHLLCRWYEKKRISCLI